MSLKIYFEGVDAIPDCTFEKDVEFLFRSIKLDGCEYDKKVIESIEKGKYLNDACFIDRFGCTISNTCLSTGTKAALSLYHCPDVLVWGGEMKSSVLTEVVKHCSQGMLLLPDARYAIFCGLEDIAIDVECKGRLYKSLDNFADYITESAPYD